MHVYKHASHTPTYKSDMTRYGQAFYMHIYKHASHTPTYKSDMTRYGQAFYMHIYKHASHTPTYKSDMKRYGQAFYMHSYKHGGHTPTYSFLLSIKTHLTIVQSTVNESIWHPTLLPRPHRGRARYCNAHNCLCVCLFVCLCVCVFVSCIYVFSQNFKV